MNKIEIHPLSALPLMLLFSFRLEPLFLITRLVPLQPLKHLFSTNKFQSVTGANVVFQAELNLTTDTSRAKHK